jgi:hypothetical protein
MVNLSKQKHRIILYLLITFYLASIASGVRPNDVAVWDEANFKGLAKSWTLDPGNRQMCVWHLLGTNVYKKISSIEVGENVNVVVFRLENFAGPYTIFDSSVHWVGKYWDNAINSLIVFPKGQAYPLGVTLSETAPNTISGGYNPEPTSQFFPLPENLSENFATYNTGGFSPTFFDMLTGADNSEKIKYITIKGDDIEAELVSPDDPFPLVISPKTGVYEVYNDDWGEYNGFKFYHISRKVTSIRVRWTGAPKERGTSVGTSTGEFIQEPSGDQTGPVTTSPIGGAPRIVSVSWQPNNKAIQVIFDQFPAELWSEQWEMYVDNIKMPVAAPQGSPSVRPNAELEKNPTGVLIGTLPWLSSISATDFPCCGAIKFCVPGKGCTNEMQFNLAEDGCKTASSKDCGSPSSSSEGQVKTPAMDQTPGAKVEPMPKPGAMPGLMVNPELIEKVIAGEALPVGTGQPPSWGGKLEYNVDLPGMNLKPGYVLSSPDPHLCANDCAKETECKAFTYVKPGFREPNSPSECWLKSGVPDPVVQEYCISGVK